VGGIFGSTFFEKFIKKWNRNKSSIYAALRGKSAFWFHFLFLKVEPFKPSIYAALSKKGSMVPLFFKNLSAFELRYFF